MGLQGVELEFRPDIAIVDADVGVLINSANGGLIHGGGTAAEISIASGELTAKEVENFSRVVEQMPGSLGGVYQEFFLTGLLRQTKVQLECALAIMAGDGEPLPQGQALLTGSGYLATRGLAAAVVHAVGMTFDFSSSARDETGRPPVIPATEEFITAAIRHGLELVHEGGYGDTIAVPKMCVGRGGMATWEQSLRAVLAGIRAGVEEGVPLKRVVIIGEAVGDLVK